MSKLESILKDLNFTKYESQALITLVKYNILDAKGIYENSGVPQPKIYETMVKLQEKGLIDILYKGRKKIYKIKPKEVLQEYILEYNRRIQSSIELIDQIYNTEESKEIPFVGFAGKRQIQNYLFTIIDTAKNCVISFLPTEHYDEKILSLLKQRKNELNIKLIFHDEKELLKVQDQLPNVEILKLKVPSFDLISQMMNTMNSQLLKDYQDIYPVQIIKDIANELKNLFGLCIVDGKKSLFRIPIPVDIPMAILSTLPQLVEFHVKGMEKILEASTLISSNSKN